MKRVSHPIHEHLVTALEVFSVLLDGFPHSKHAWGHLDIHPKTLQRYLDTFVATPELQTSRGLRDGQVTYRTTYKLVPTPPHYLKKKCTGCRKILPASAFHKNRRTPTGLKDYCKTCARLSWNEWKEANREWYLRKERERYQKKKARKLSYLKRRKELTTPNGVQR